MTLTLPSFAKINWTLEVLGRRADGYHELRTLLQTVSVADELTFEIAGQGIELHCAHPAVPLDETNLVWRAAALLREFAGIERGVRITLKKNLPLAAGLGGGSSNAAVTLLALRKLWEVRIAPRELFQLGARLGADVPFFFLGGTCLGVGRGDEVYPVADLSAEHLLLVNTGLLVPTREVYGGLPAELTNPNPVAKMPFSLQAAYRHMCCGAAELADSLPHLHNDLETTVFTRYPLLVEIKERLARAGARGVLMSGSGSTIFALFDNAATCFAAQQDLQKNGWWCAATRTLSRAEYQLALAALTRA